MLTRILPLSLRTPFMSGAAALALLASPIVLDSARAAGIEVRNCVSTFHGYSCVTRFGEAGDAHIRTVPAFPSQREEAEAAERDRKWMAHCRPVIEQDQYGARRYRYAARGCEYGRTGD